MIAPHIYFMCELGENYHGIYMLESDAEVHYLARVREFVDGNSYGNPYIYDFKDNVPTTFLTLGEGIQAIPSIIFGVSVPNMNLIFKFILPIIITLLIYRFSRKIGLAKKYSIAASLLIVLGHALMHTESLIAFLKLEPIAQQFTLYARPINPQLSSLFFFGYLNLIIHALEKKTWKPFIFSGLILGAVFYIYLYAYLFMATFSVMLVLILLISKQKTLVPKMLTSTIIGITIGVPAMKALVDMQTHPFFPKLAEALTVTSTRKPIIGISYVAIFIILLIYFFKSKKSKRKPAIYMLLTLFCTMFAVTNQQVITGKEVHHAHFIWYYGGPMLTLAILFLISKVYKEKKYLHSGLTGLFVFLAVSSSIFWQYSTYNYWEKDYTSKQDYATVLNWINQNTEPESAILADEEISYLIPVYTAANDAWTSNYGGFYLLPNDSDYFSLDYLLENNFETPYCLDYIVWDKQEEPEWQIETGELVYEDQRFDIYDLTNSQSKEEI